MQQQSSTSSLSLILFSISLLSTTTSALPQPQWAESSTVAYAVTTEAPVYTSTSNWATAVTWPAGCETWLNPCPPGAFTSGVAPTPAVVTWPAGCQNWANPCPASAIISAGEPYSNPFTSYTTMTNSVGIITGMPSVATSAGGVASVLSEQSVALETSTASMMTAAPSSESAGSSIVSPTASQTAMETASATTDSSFSQATFTGAAVANRAAGAGAALVAMGIAFAL